MPDATPNQITAFIERWEHSGAAERANYTSFLCELCTLLDLPRPDPTSPDNSHNAYVFERAITRRNPDGTTSTGFIDLYRRGSLMLESKQGTNAAGETDSPLAAPAAPVKTGHGKRGTAAFDKALERAYHQARSYITALPAEEGRPPFLIVCDVGHSIDIYAEFTGTGGQYERFPDPVSHRITLPDLHRPDIRERLRKVWLDPHSLDPSKFAAAVTRDIAGRLAVLAKSLETDGHDPQVIAGFLQRCLFTLFAEDVGLLPEDGFKTLLERLKDSPQGFPVLVSGLWKEMATGTRFSALLFKEIACFNGGLFENTSALPLSAAQLAMLMDAAATDWSAVEPSIFGTLLTRALDSRERHKLGAEYTPRAYVERLIRPTIIEPLREEWAAVRIAAVTLHDEADRAEDKADQAEADAKAKMAAGDSAGAKQLGAEAADLRKAAKKSNAEALQQVIAFHRRLCKLRILDPACGTANFLYVTMEHMKRLEAEVLELITGLGGDAGMEMHGFRVRPEQFIGLELNQQAVAIAQLVLWIGYFQWQRKTTGKADTGDRPLLPKDRSIYEQDAVLAYDERIPRRDPQSGEILTVWNGYTNKLHPVTGKEVPDESARRALFDYTNPRRAEWPPADFITGNPPFIGASRMREALGDGYVEALRKVWQGDVPESADFVMFWWRKAAELVRDGKAKRFGFITTNSIHQTFNRRVLEPFVVAASSRNSSLHLAYAIPDHPWIDSADGAAVRIAMTVAAPGHGAGILEKVIAEQAREDGENEVTLSRSGGVLAANLQTGADLTSCGALQANSKISCPGVKLHGSGFIVSTQTAADLGYGTITGIEEHIRGCRNGKDLTNRPREVKLIDLFGLKESEAASRFPSLYQHVLTHVKPERDQNNRDTYRLNWWIFGEPRRDFRPALDQLPRYIATVETSKHRFFTFLDKEILPDNMLIAIASDDAFHLGILSSQVHVVWALVAGGRLGMGNDPRYNKSRCFEPFPFPALEDGELKQRIRDLGERLDAHRKRQQALHPGLTLTGIYNVLERLRGGDHRSPRSSRSGDGSSPPPAPLTAKDKAIHDQGLVSVLKQIHDDLDAAVLEAYGWSDLSRSVGVSPTFGKKECGRGAHAPCADLLARGGPDAEALEQQLLTRLVALNHERAAEEKRGLIRWLRPNYQAPGATSDGDGHRPPLQAEIDLDDSSHPLSTIHDPLSLPDWPADLPGQVAALRKLLPAIGLDPEDLAACFGRKSQKRTAQITGILATLKSLGLIA
ncbi:MAG: class I SAM-dependent DNA methyltransferase [Verrucomicrobia bacterium]|nr:class I SAM-dependent DNA methyltransferase [Verrucomicrobiota bacterium]